MNTIQALWDLFLDLWDTGNYFARLAILVLIGWPIAITVTAFIFQNSTLTAIVALIPFFSLLLLLFAFIDPLVWAVVASTERGRTGLKWLGAVIGVELTIGVLLSIVPIGNDRGLLPLLLLSIFALAFVQFISNKDWRVNLSKLLGLVVASIVLIMFFGGRGSLRHWDTWFDGPSSARTRVRPPSFTITKQTAVVTEKKVVPVVELSLTEGTVLQWIPEENRLIVEDSEEVEKVFKVTRDTQVIHNNKTYYLGWQGLLSSRSGADLKPGYKVKIRHEEARVVGIEVLGTENMSPQTASRNIKDTQESTLRESEKSLRMESRAEEGRTLRGIVQNIFIEDKQILLQTSNEYIVLNVFEETPVVLDNIECSFESLRPGDEIIVTYLPGTSQVRKIESYREDLQRENYRLTNKAPTESMWRRYY